MKHKIFVFDFDGTLVQSNEIKRSAFYDSSGDFRQHRDAVDNILTLIPEKSRFEIIARIYDLIAADTEWVSVGGKWNLYEIKAQNGHIQLFQNTHKIIDTYFWTDEWIKLIANSKFNQWSSFGTFKSGHISFQGTESGKLLFRNIRIKQL